MKNLKKLELFTKAFEDLPIGIGIFYVPDLEDIRSIEYVFMNKIILHEMQKSKEEVFGKRIIEVAPEAYQHEGGLLVIKTYQRIAKEGGNVNLGLVEYSNHLTEGTYECSIHHLIDNYVYIMLRNVTELEQAKNKLELKNKELKQFAYVASHDLKQPLVTISNFVNVLQKKYENTFDDNATQMFSFIMDASERMNQLINDLLDYGSLGQKEKMTFINCNEILKEVQQDLATAIKQSNSTIIIDQLPTIKGYKTSIRLLFQNLISNAIKFKKPDTHPIVKISASEDIYWTFSIEDNGIGIAEENTQKIFNVFKRLHSRSEYEGTGIGLAHCKKIVDLHKGKIWVTSTVGKGSTFVFTIPKNK